MHDNMNIVSEDSILLEFAKVPLIRGPYILPFTWLAQLKNKPLTKS